MKHAAKLSIKQNLLSENFLVSDTFKVYRMLYLIVTNHLIPLKWD